jgi:acyl-coenzyme A synthetase/AMP-(fatty) acid ligase
MGKPLPGMEVRIVPSEEVDGSGVGELQLRAASSPTFFSRYLDGERFEGEWWPTGDLVREDADGYLYFEGRRDDMFKRKGIRMSTLEIEAAAMDIPGVRAAGAIPPSETRDLAICVETDLPPTTVLRELAKRLEPQKVPSLCRVVAEFPLTAHGKNAMKELALLVEGSRK